jgi:divalent metal cation (Fe/Co/Zn/Cd) transporter
VRRSGLGLFVDIHVMVDAEIPVRHGHDIGHQVQAALVHGDLGVVDVVVHVEPDPDPHVAPSAGA